MSRTQPLQRRSWLLDYGLHDRQQIVARERRPAGQHLEQRYAQRPDICTRVSAFSAHLFRSHVGDGPGGRSRLREPRGRWSIRSQHLRQTEVENWYLAVWSDHDVGRLQVAMDDTHRVGVGHTVSDLTQNRDDLRERKRATRQFLLNRLTSAVRQSDVGHGLPLADFVDRRDIGVIEAARDLRFTNQTSRVLPVLVIGPGTSAPPVASD